MTIAIYAGLSISFEECKTILDAEYYPPVKRGDIYNLISSRNDIEIIGIVDGLFHQSPAVAHKEILKALQKGITVVGGSSMGALRACELYPYGMIGVGHIFNDYKNGVIESDDDVAVALNPETYEQLSDSWINIKYNFEQAQKEDIITNDEKIDLLDTAKEIYYPKRTFEYVIKKSNLSKEKITMLNTYIKNNKFDIKHDDAREVIEYIKKISSNKQ